MKHITKVRELYEETIHWISESEDSWKNFLSCMGRLYQLDFLNTCMVYAQRPDASVLAGYDAWLEMDLPVARGSKGIAVFPSKIFGEGVTHVYDIQDVKGQGIRPWNWQVNGTNRRLLARELFPEIYEQEKKFKNSLDAFTRTNVWLMIEEEDEILKSLQKLAVLTGEGQEVKENQITELLVNSVMRWKAAAVSEMTPWIFLLSAVFQRTRRFCTGQGGWYPIYLGGLCYRLQGP